MLLVHRRDIVEPIEIRERLQIGFMFDELLGGAVNQAEKGVDALDHLPIEFEHEAKNTVRRRMLRSEINDEVALRRLAQNSLRSIGAHAARQFSHANSGPWWVFRTRPAVHPVAALDHTVSVTAGRNPPRAGSLSRQPYRPPDVVERDLPT